MRERPQSVGTVQRQVTARPVAGLQAPQQQVLIDPNASSFAKGLADFADVSAGVVKQVQAENLDAQAAVADIGLDGYNRAMKGALDSDPELYDRPDELAKLDQQMREQYFSGITDERIKTRISSRVDNWLASSGQTYQYEKAEKQRFELGARTMQLGIEKLEAGVQSGAISDDDAAAQVKALYQTLRTSPSFRMSEERSQKLVMALQDMYAKDGTRRVLLAKAFKDDESMGVEARMSLEADLAEAMQKTEAEKQQAKFALYQSWEPLIESGKFTWEHGEKAVAAGMATAEEVRAGLRRQQSRLEKRIKEAQEGMALTGDPRLMDAKTFSQWEAKFRAEAPKEHYYSVMKQVGGVNPALKAQAQRAMTTTGSLVESEDQIPSAFTQFMDGDAAYLHGAGLLSQHIPPEALEDTSVYLYMTQNLGKSKVEAYNLLVNSAASKYSDLDRKTLAELANEVRSELDIDPDRASNVVNSTASLAMKYVKATGMDPKEAKKHAIAMTKAAYIETDFGPLARARYGSYTSDDGIKQRLNHTADETLKSLKAEGYDVKRDDLSVLMLDDGRFGFMQKGGVNFVGGKTFRLMTSNEPTLPTGEQTVEGSRQEKIINDQLRPKRTRRQSRHGTGRDTD